MKTKYLFIALLAILLTHYAGGQTVLLYFQTFEMKDSSFTLNGTGIGTNTGSNQWIINNKYAPNTIGEDSTFGGSISYAPYSNYLHIYDVPSGDSNCNYNPANASDRFAYTTNGVCTFGLKNVSVNFFYLCQGSATAYGTVYYSADKGPWKPCGAAHYDSTYKWQYTTITDTAFNNLNNLRIGFRWQNNTGSGTDTSSFAIDDFNITGVPNSAAITINTSVTPDTICSDGNQPVKLSFTLSDSLGSGNYAINLYDSAHNDLAGWIVNITSDSLTQGPYTLHIPNFLKGNHCYIWQVNRLSGPTVSGTLSSCFYVEKCPTTINTQQPVATMDSTHSVCAGSSILVPFYSTGEYGYTNIYWTELSDSSGNFAWYDSLSSSLFSSSAYPSFGPEGKVFAWIPDTMPAGNHYYLRVCSGIPYFTGTSWGPFSIKHCDMNINTAFNGGGGGNNAGSGRPTSLLACIHSCAKDPGGFTDTLRFDINSYASNVTYGPGNKFKVQLLSTSDFSVANTGLLGVDSASGKMIWHVPCADSICGLNLLTPPAYGGYGGTFYMRLIATNANPPDSNVGPLVLLNIGYPNDSLTLTPPSPSNFYYGNTAIFNAVPLNTCTEDQNNSNTVYYWYLDGYMVGVWGDAIGFLEPVGTDTVVVKENNNGCFSQTDTAYFSVIKPPALAIAGPASVCTGDTNSFSVSFNHSTCYRWHINNFSFVNNGNNIAKGRFNSPGTYRITVYAADSARADSAYKYITVKNCTSGITQINEAEADISIYPNPSPGIFNLAINNEPHAKISIQNMLGQVVYTADGGNSGNITRQIDLTACGKGIYFLRVISDRGVDVRKIVVE